MSAAPVIPIDQKSLYEITDHLAALFESLDGIEDADLRRQCESEIDIYLIAEVRKVDRITSYLAHCEAQQQLAADEIKRLQERKRSLERAQERVEASVERVMTTWGLQKLEGRTSSLSLKKCPASVEVLDIKEVPDAYKRITVSEAVDKTAARVELAAGREIPGLRLITDRKSVCRR